MSSPLTGGTPTGTTPGTALTDVAIVGGGPAGLMLSHLLALRGFETIVIDTRTRSQIENTVRAGMLEHDNAEIFSATGVSDRFLTKGVEHEGISLRFDGVSHRIDFRDLVGASVWLYAQTDLFSDLAEARARDGGDVRFGVSGTQVEGIEGPEPAVLFTDADGRPWRVRCRYVVGADGAGSYCRSLIPATLGRRYVQEYPWAWFGFVTQAPRSAAELVFVRSLMGFALVSQRSKTEQLMYFQCPPHEDPKSWSQAQIWDTMQARVAGPDGFSLLEGPIIARAVMGFTSFVIEPMQHGRLLLAGDAAHTVPPTGAKGLNLALADVRLLDEVLSAALCGDVAALRTYTPRALGRIWRAQHFSYWMTSMLHTKPGDSAFSVRRQLGELTSVVSSPHGAAYLAEAYTGWPGSAD